MAIVYKNDEWQLKVDETNSKFYVYQGNNHLDTYDTLEQAKAHIDKLVKLYSSMTNKDSISLVDAIERISVKDDSYSNIEIGSQMQFPNDPQVYEVTKVDAGFIYVKGKTDGKDKRVPKEYWKQYHKDSKTVTLIDSIERINNKDANVIAPSGGNFSIYKNESGYEVFIWRVLGEMLYSTKQPKSQDDYVSGTSISIGEMERKLGNNFRYSGQGKI